MLDIALKYVNRGWSVFPCSGKVPLTADGFKSASKDIVKVTAFFTEHKDANIAVVTGKSSGIFVLDIDIKNKVNGQESLDSLEDLNGVLPRTLEARTWSGGRHLFFKYPEGEDIRSRIGVRPGIDIKADGGYVIAPHSKIDGMFYTWLTDLDVADAPEWLLQLTKEKKESKKIKDKKDIIESERNETLTSFAGKLYQVGATKSEVVQTLFSLNKTRCIPPLPDEEVEGIAKSVGRYDNTSEYTEIWMSEQFSFDNKDKLLYCPQLGSWYMWNRNHWTKDDLFSVQNRMTKWLSAKLVEANSTKDILLGKLVRRCSTDNKVSALLSSSRAVDGMSISADELDGKPGLLNCPNGILDLDQHKLLPSNPNEKLSNLTSVKYDKEAKCHRWLQFLDQIFLGDKDIIRYVQKAVGYSMSGYTQEQCFFIFYGGGDNGKTTFTTAIEEILNDYSKQTPADTLMDNRSSGAANSDVARLKGARFVSASESDRSKNLAESKIKHMTGSETMTARYLYQEFFEFKPTFKIFLSTNYLPNVRGTDKGIWRRIIPIPFNLVVKEEDKDKGLSDKLRKEYEGIFAWAVEGYAMWKKEGLERSEQIKDMLNIYKEDTDVVGAFIEEQCEIGAGFEEPASYLVRDLNRWLKEEGADKLGRYEAIDIIKKKGFTRYKRKDGKYVWRGLRRKATGPEAEEGF